MKSIVTLIFGLLLCGGAMPAHAADTPVRNPNIVLILADDLGIVDLNAYAARFTGAKPSEMFYETPNLDRLASQGVSFSQAYAAHLCSPARSSILTGKNAARVGFTTAVGGTVQTFYSQAVPPPPGYIGQDAIEWPDPNIKIEQALLNGTTLDALPAGQPADLGHDETTLAEALKGYRSAFIGKWHLGGHGSRGWQPADQGFEEISYFDEGGSPYFNWRPLWDRRALVHPKMPQAELLQGKSGGNLGQNYLTDELTEHAVRFIKKEVDAQDAKPFLLYLCHFAVHMPPQAPEEGIKHFEGKATRGWNGQNNAIYASMLERLDHSVGRIMETLVEAGIDDNTLIVFVSDNGGWTYGNPAATTNAPFKGGKALHYEGGIRVPLIFRWPGHVPAGEWCDVPVDICDLFPTLLALAKENGGADPDLDGRSLVPLFADLSNQTQGYDRDTFYWHYPFNVIVPNPDDGLPAPPHSTTRQGDWKLLFDWSGEMKLYNIAEDPYEREELSARHPEKALELFRKLNDWLDANVDVKYMPALNPAYDPSKESRTRPFVDLRKKYLGDDRAIRHPDSDPRFQVLAQQKQAAAATR